MKILKEMKVGDIVTDDYRAAEVFKQYGIDFCCGGNQNLDFLCDYLVNEFHNKVYRVLPPLSAYLNKIADVHGNNHPELIEIAELFSLINTEMPVHQHQEENIFFPAIKELVQTNSSEAKRILNSQISLMMEEHELIGGTMDKISVLTHHYLVPEDGCNTYRVTYQMLEEFEDDLHTHVHLENHILFPKALKLAE